MAIRIRSINTALLITLLLGAGISGCNRTQSTATLLAEAKQFQQKGENKAALIQLKNAVANSPEDGQARIALAALYNEMGDAVSAEKESRMAIRLHVGAEQTLPILGKSLVAQGQYQKMLDEIPENVASQSAALMTLRGTAHLALKETVKAKSDFDRSLALPGAPGDALVGLAMYALTTKDDAAAARYVADAVGRDPKNTAVWMVQAMMLRKDGKQQEALATYDKVLALQPEHRGVHLEKAYIEIGQNNFTAAQADIEAAKKNAPGNPINLYVQALLDVKQNKNSAALESLQKLLKIAPDYPPAIRLAGQVELSMGAVEQAERHLRRYLETDPQDLWTRKLLANILLQKAQPDDAAALLGPSMKDASLDPQMQALAGHTALLSNDYGKATEYFEKATKLMPKSAELRTALGVSKLGKGDPDAAISELEMAATLDPKSPRPGFALVQAELQLRHFDKAMAAVQALEKQRPKDAELQYLKGTVLQAQGNLPGARAAFEKAVALNPVLVAAVANLARLDVQDNKPDAAKKRFEVLLAADKKNIPAMMALAELARRQNQPGQVTAWLEKAVAENPDLAAPALTLAEQYMRTRQESKALTLMRQVQTAHPTDPAVLDMLGQVQLATKDGAGALDTFGKLVAVSPKSAAAQMRLASAHMATKNEALAIQDLKQAVQLDPRFLPARLALGEMAMRKGRPEEALALARDMQKLDARNAAGYVMEGELQTALKKPALAQEAFEKALSISKSPQLMVKVAEAMKQAGKDPELRLNTWEKEHPGDAFVSSYRADQLLSKKQYKPAIERFEALQRATPNNVGVLNNLALAYQQLDDPRALSTAQKALAVAPENPAVIDTMGWILLQRGDAARALPLLQKAVAMAPASAELRYHLAAALNKTGDKKKAREELDKVLSGNNTFPQIEDAKALQKLL